MFGRGIFTTLSSFRHFISTNSGRGKLHLRANFCRQDKLKMADVKELHSKDSTKCRETLDELKQLKIKLKLLMHTSNHIFSIRIASLEKEKTIYNHKVVSNLLHSLASEETKLDKKRHNESNE